MGMESTASAGLAGAVPELPLCTLPTPRGLGLGLALLLAARVAAMKLGLLVSTLTVCKGELPMPMALVGMSLSLASWWFWGVSGVAEILLPLAELCGPDGRGVPRAAEEDCSAEVAAVKAPLSFLGGGGGAGFFWKANEAPFRAAAAAASCCEPTEVMAERERLAWATWGT